jgi:hypothetical protein
MKKNITALLFTSLFITAISQEDTTTILSKQKGEPLEGMDCTWWNGGDRRSIAQLCLANILHQR